MDSDEELEQQLMEACASSQHKEVQEDLASFYSNFMADENKKSSKEHGSHSGDDDEESMSSKSSQSSADSSDDSSSSSSSSLDSEGEKFVKSVTASKSNPGCPPKNSNDFLQTKNVAISPENQNVETQEPVCVRVASPTNRTPLKQKRPHSGEDIEEATLKKTRQNWPLEEIKILLKEVFKRKLFDWPLPSPAKDPMMYQNLQNHLVQAGFSRQTNQLYKKLGQLKSEYDQMSTASDSNEKLRKKNYFRFFHELFFNKSKDADSPVVRDETPNLDDVLEPVNLEPDKSQNSDAFPSPPTSVSDGSLHRKSSSVDASLPQNSSEKSKEVSVKELNDKPKKNLWTNPEISDLLSLALANHLFEWKDSDILTYQTIYNKISNDMKKSGHLRSTAEITTKISSLRQDYTKGKEKISKSGEAGLKYVLQWRPYWKSMVELFGTRPKENCQGIDALDEEGLLNLAVMKEKNDSNVRPLKKPPSNTLNLLDKSLDKSHEQTKEMVQEMMKHEEKIAKENREAMTTAATTVVTGIKDIFQPLLAAHDKKKKKKKKRKH